MPQQPPPPQLSLRIPPTTDDLPRLLDALEAFSEEAELSPKAAHRLALVVEELAANVAMHGASGAGAATYVDVAVRLEGDSLLLTVEDDGRAFDPLAQGEADTDSALEERDVGGLGIHFVRQMTRDLNYVRDGGRNRLSAVLDAEG